MAVLAAAGALVALLDVPTLALPTRGGRKQEYDAPALVALLHPYVGLEAHVILEASQSMPGQGVRSTWTIGYGYGLWIGVLAALQLAYTPVRAVTWKRALGVAKDKEVSRLRAMQLFPGADLRRKKDHGRAEALLLAYYGCQCRTAVQSANTPAR